MKKTILLSAILFMLLLSNPLFAQSDPGNDPNVPVDGGISALLAAGAIYGIKKIKENRRK
jgi:hypothetical protein